MLSQLTKNVIFFDPKNQDLKKKSSHIRIQGSKKHRIPDQQNCLQQRRSLPSPRRFRSKGWDLTIDNIILYTWELAHCCSASILVKILALFFSFSP